MKNNFVKIVWHDIAGLTSGNNSLAWLDKKECEKEGERLWNQEYTTIGEVIIETKNYIVIAATFDGEELYSDASMIMKSVIIRIEKLR